MSERKPPAHDPQRSQTSNKDDAPKGGVTRRSLLTSIGAAGIAVTATPVIAAATIAAEPTRRAVEDAPAPGTIPVKLSINGKAYALNIEPRVTLLDCLRENLDLTGTKKGCDHGQCGACTVHINGRRVNSCLTFAAMHQGDQITTIEGIGQPGNLHAMQAAFVEHDGFQCGYCTSGQIMSAVAMMKESWGAEDKDVKEAMAGNICRCGAYPNIVAAVQQVRGNGRRGA
jgi:xanthine dehydrogenase YagT iron-sulfur-binding subunit